jgi:hypothetical protein
VNLVCRIDEVHNNISVDIDEDANEANCNAKNLLLAYGDSIDLVVDNEGEERTCDGDSNQGLKIIIIILFGGRELLPSEVSIFG